MRKSTGQDKGNTMNPFLKGRSAFNLTLILGCGLLLSSLSLGAESNYFQSADVFELEYATDPQVSPDGEQVAYVRRSNDIMTDSTRSNICLLYTSDAADE